MTGERSLEESTISTSPLTPAVASPSVHQSTNSPTVSSSFRQGTTIETSTDSCSVSSASGSSVEVLTVHLPCGLGDVGVDGVEQSLGRGVGAAPAQRGEAVAAEAHDRHVALPPARAARVLVADALQAHPLHHEVGDLAHRDVVAGAGVEDLKALPPAVEQGEHRRDHVGDVDV